MHAYRLNMHKVLGSGSTVPCVKELALFWIPEIKEMVN